MTIYLVKGYLDVAATTLADAQSLITALADQTDPDNLATIARITDKLETLVQSDSGEPLVISSIDDANGNISSWVTNTTEQLAFAIGDPSPTTDLAYAVANVSTIAGNTRTGTLALNTDRLQAAVGGWRGQPMRGQSPQFLAHIRKANVTTGYTETVARLPFQVLPGVLLSTTQAVDEVQVAIAAQYAAQAAASAAEAEAATVLGLMPTLSFFGNATDEQTFGYFYAEAATEILGMQIAAQVAPAGAALTVDLVNSAGVEQSRVGTLAAGAQIQRTAFGTSLTLAAGSYIRGKLKSVGSTAPGGYLTINLICRAPS